ncbi:MAG TPA: glycosyltransferase [Longimicrobiales bacterium]
MSKRILYLQYTNPAAYPPLQHSASILAEHGWEVLFLGIAARGAAPLKLPAHQRVQYERIGGVSGGPFAALKYAAFSAGSLRAATRFRPDWCYASDAHSAPAALLLRRLLRTRTLYHEHDAPSPNVLAALLERARDQLARNAELVIAPSATRLEMIPVGSGRRVVVWNCPRRIEVGTERSAPDDRFRLVYHGSLSRERLTPQFIDALAMLPAQVELDIYGYETQGHAGYAGELLRRAQQAGVGERVRYHGAVPERAQLLEQLRGHQLGISTVATDSADRNLRTLAGASNKAFEYLACRIPLLISEEPSWQQLYQEPGYAVTCRPNDARSIAAAVQPLVEDTGRAREMGRRGCERILSEWNYETQFAPVLEYLSA